jgi:hypothetical protein
MAGASFALSMGAGDDSFVDALSLAGNLVYASQAPGGRGVQFHSSWQPSQFDLAFNSGVEQHVGYAGGGTAQPHVLSARQILALQRVLLI